MKHTWRLLAAALAAAPAACDTAPAHVAQDAGRDTASPDAATATDAGDAGDAGDATTGTVCTPNTPFTGCAEGEYCETTARVCVECVALESRCGAGGVRERCEAPVVDPVTRELVSGGYFEPDPCGAEQVCVTESSVRATCEDVVCEANERRCVDAQVLACNANGTEETLSTCDPGMACYQGACEMLRHNVLLIFDTSGSMQDFIDSSYTGTPTYCAPGEQVDALGQPCFQPFPVCEDPKSERGPFTLIGLAKEVFYDSVREAIDGFAQFALQRFPQREAGALVPQCWSGWYVAQNAISGDDGARDTATGTWFHDNLSEVVVVPFPARNNLDNEAELLEWLDTEETLGASDRPCHEHWECGTGRCGTVNGEGRCFYHDNNELRALSETPLGKSLFYAGEYFRRYVVVDGKPCTTSSDCGSAGYLCRDAVCVDPYRKCRDNYIILFTDGDESEHKEETDFFNPVVQARRLAFGLDCAGDDDCRGGATCVDGMCLAPSGYLQPPLAPMGTGGFGALSSPDGQPISVKTTVITLESGAGASVKNRRIATAGGGVHLDANAGDPAAFKALLIDAMSPNFKCEPEEL